MLGGNHTALLAATRSWVQIVRRLRGELPLPWESDMGKDVMRGLTVFKKPVQQLLERDPLRRSTVRSFHAACTAQFDEWLPYPPEM